MIIGRDFLVQIVLTTNFKQQVLSWADNVFPTKEQVNFLGHDNLTKRKMRKVVMQTE